MGERRWDVGGGGGDCKMHVRVHARMGSGIVPTTSKVVPKNLELLNIHCVMQIVPHWDPEKY